MLSPGAWLSVLERQLAEQQREIQIYEDYFDGRHRMAFATTKFRNAFGSMFRALADNWCRIVVEAPVERLVIEGYRFGGAEAADVDARDIWQANSLDSESIMAHTEAVKNGRAYLMVAPPPQDSDQPLITVEHPSQVIVAHAPGNRRARLAALKKWRGEDGHDYANVYLPNGIYKFRSKEAVRPGQILTRNWTATEGSGSNPLGVVPIIPLYNNPSMLSGGQSDLVTAIPLQDAINKEIADMLVASEFAAFPQRVATGVEVPTLEDGSPDPSFELKTSISRLLVSENENANFSSLAAADLSNYVNAIAMLLQHLAAQTRTPPHYLLGQIVNASGDALKAAETGLTAKSKRKMVDFGESWEEAMRLAFKLKGKAAQANDLGAEVIWRDPEYRSFGELVDGVVKLSAIGVPQAVLWERAGFSQLEIDRMRTMQETDELLNVAIEPPPVEPAPPALPVIAG